MNGPLNHSTVLILLATYNGGKFLVEQVESILRQSHTDWLLLVSDDASSDETPGIIASYVMKYPGKIFPLQGTNQNGGSVANFGRLFATAQNHNPSYIMFCDQDDVWLPHKIEESLHALRCREEIVGTQTPLLVHTNFTYVYADLRPIPEKANFEARKLNHLGLAQLMVQSPLYGCTMLMNAALVQRVGEIPLYAENHDYWVAMVASAFGEILYLPQSTMLYRQHGDNISTQHDDNSMQKRWKRLFASQHFDKEIRFKKAMAAGFLQRYQDGLIREQQTIIQQYLLLLEKPTLSKALSTTAKGMRKQTLAQTFLFYTMLLLRPATRGVK